MSVFADTAETEPQHASPRRRRNPAPLILGAVAVLLLAYYAVVGLSGVTNISTEVPIEGNPTPATDSYITLRFKTDDIDLTNRLMQASVIPVPHGDLVGEKTGEISEALRIEIVSGGATTSVVTVPGESIIDPTAVTFALDRGDTAYPFDQPFSTVQISVRRESDGVPVPFDIAMENAARPWVLEGTVTEDDGTTLFTIDGARDPLAILLVSFYVIAILLTTLMAVVTIGTAILRRKLEFANIIWLSATMLSFPALRSAMPGAPPIGTALDFLVFFPCICLIAGMLLWTGGYLLWRESAILRKRTLDDEEEKDTNAASAALAAAEE